MTVFALPPCGHFFRNVCRREGAKKVICPIATTVAIGNERI